VYVNVTLSEGWKKKCSINIANRSFEDGAKFKYLGKTLRDQNCMREEFKSRLHF
jgi:hypothetical protein